MFGFQLVQQTVGHVIVQQSVQTAYWVIHLWEITVLVSVQTAYWAIELWEITVGKCTDCLLGYTIVRDNCTYGLQG